MIFCARATRGLRRPSLNTRSGRPSSPPSREKIGKKRFPVLYSLFNVRVNSSNTMS